MQSCFYGMMTCSFCWEYRYLILFWNITNIFPFIWLRKFVFFSIFSESNTIKIQGRLWLKNFHIKSHPICLQFANQHFFLLFDYINNFFPIFSESNTIKTQGRSWLKNFYIKSHPIYCSFTTDISLNQFISIYTFRLFCLYPVDDIESSKRPNKAHYLFIGNYHSTTKYQFTIT